MWLHLHVDPRNRLFSLVLFPTQLPWGQGWGLARSDTGPVTGG